MRLDSSVVGESPAVLLLLLQHGRRLEETFQHAGRTAVLKTFVRRERVFGAVFALAELADVERVGAFVFVLEMSL